MRTTMRETGLEQMQRLALLIEDGDAQDFGAAVAIAMIDVGDGLDDLGRAHRGPSRRGGSARRLERR